MNYAITGGLGYIGSKLALELLQQEHHVTIIDNVTTHTLKEYEAVRNELLKYPRCLIIPQGVEQLDTRLLIKIDCVFHLAALSDVDACEKNPSEAIRINLEMTKTLIRKCKDAEVKKIVFTSSAAVYGLHKNCYEELIIYDTDQINTYGSTKYKAELEIIKSGMDFKIARPSNVYGKGLINKDNVIHLFVKEILKGNPVMIHGSGEQSRDFIHLNDVVSALIFLSNLEEKGLFNISTGKSTKVKSIAIKLMPGSNKRIKHDSSDREIEIGLNNYKYDNAKILSRGWKPRVDLYHGLRLCLSDFKI
jgi:UDP-glucose 4-epimerase